MEFQGTLLAVSDMERAKRFYCSVLEREVIADFGANVTLSGQIFLQTLDTWKQFLQTEDVHMEHRAAELYFEEADLDQFLLKLKEHGVRLVHPLIEHRWGQRVVRFYDPDGHIIEVGEKLSAVMQRFCAQGMTEEQIAVHMDVPLELVRNTI